MVARIAVSLLVMTHGNDDREFEEANEYVMRELVEEVLAFASFLSVKDVTGGNLWFRNLLVGILRSAYENYRSIKANIAEGPTRVAWSARNLLELRAITYYVLASEENAQDFLKDVPVDKQDFLRAITTNAEIGYKLMANLLRKVGLDSEEGFKDVIEKADEVEKRQSDASALRQDSELDAMVIEEPGTHSSRRSKHGMAIAGLVEDDSTLGIRYQIYSKFIHQTAFSILAPEQGDVCGALIPVISKDADTNISFIFAAIKSHVEAHGLIWPN